jgi:hypothetical protein
MSHRNSHAPTIMLVVIALLFCSLPFNSTGSFAHTVASTTQRRAYTPPHGSAERKAILDALRDETRQLHQANVIFVVNYLKVQNGWAWVQTSPQSPDGSNRYEDVSALLRKRRNVWMVVEIACTEEDNPNCIGDEGYYKKLRNRFPLAPRGIFPGQ